MNTKTCARCQNEMTLDNFCALKNGTYNSYCRKCASQLAIESQRKRRRESPLEHYPRSSYTSVQQRSINGKYSTSPSVLANAQQNSYHTKGIRLLMTFDQWLAFWKENEQKVLDIISMGDVPSVDRINSNLDYSVDNVRIIPLSENRKKSKNGITVSRDKKTASERNREAYLRTHPGARINNYKGA